MAPETPGKLASFEDFVRRMKSWLTLVPEGGLESLLECLYEAAKAKIEFEDYRKWAQDMAGSYRNMRKAMEVTGKALSKASRILQKAEEDNKELGQIKCVEGDFDLGQIKWVEGDFKFRFDEVTQQVNRARKAAEDSDVFLAAMIHPHFFLRSAWKVLRISPVCEWQNEPALAPHFGQGKRSGSRVSPIPTSFP